jgi:hypothetical protein
MKLLLLAFIVAVLQITRADDVLTKQKLYKDLEKNYDKEVEPGFGTTITAGVAFICAKLDPETNKLSTRVYERHSWTDKRLSWKPADYAGIKSGSVTINDIWSPDFRLFNAFVNSEVRDDVNAVVLANGTVYWIPPVTYTTLCAPSKDKDDHSYHCRLTLGVWTYDGETLPLELYEGGWDTVMYLKECPYVIKNAKAYIEHAKYDCCTETFDRLEVTFDVVENDHDDDHHDDDEDEKIDYSKCRWPHCD